MSIKPLPYLFLSVVLVTACNWDTYGPEKIVPNFWLMSIDSWEHPHIFYAEDPLNRTNNNMLVPFTVKNIYLSKSHMVVTQIPDLLFENDSNKVYHLIELANHKNHLKFSSKNELDSALELNNLLNILKNEYKR